MRKQQVIKLLQAMSDNSRACSAGFKKDDPAFSDRLKAEALAFQTVIWILSDDEKAQGYWKVFFPD